jgi:hypothetical protein
LACSLTNSERHGRSIAETRGEARATPDFVRRVRPTNLAAVGCSSRQNTGSLEVPTLSVRVPIRVCRPLFTGEALRRSPLMEAGGAYPASVEGVPLIAATTRPAVILAGRPAAERAPNARTGRVEAFLLFGLAINNNRGVIREGAHARLLSPSSDRPMWRKILSLLRKKSRPSFQIVCLPLIESHCLFHAYPRRWKFGKGLQGCVVESLHSLWTRQVSMPRVRTSRK